MTYDPYSYLTQVRLGPLSSRLKTTEELTNSLVPLVPKDDHQKSAGEDTKGSLLKCLTLSKALTESLYGDLFESEKGRLLSHCCTLLKALEDPTTIDEPVWEMDALVKDIQRSYVETINTCTSAGYTNACSSWKLYMPPADELVYDPHDSDISRHTLLSYVETRPGRDGSSSETARARYKAHRALSSVIKSLPNGTACSIRKALGDNVGMFTNVRDTKTDLRSLVRICADDPSVQTAFEGDCSDMVSSGEDGSAFLRHWRETKDTLAKDLRDLTYAIDTQDPSTLDPSFKKFCRSALAHYATHLVIDSIGKMTAAKERSSEVGEEIDSDGTGDSRHGGDSDPGDRDGRRRGQGR